MAKLIGYARVSTRDQSTDRQQTDLVAAGVRRDDLYIDHGVSGARASRPEFERALAALIDGDTLVITTLDRLADRPRTCSLSPKSFEVVGPVCESSISAEEMLTPPPRWGQ